MGISGFQIPNQDLADNIHILESGTWTTYWHDGSNLNITTPAEISVRKGSGAGGALTGNDFSFTSGTIEGLSKPSHGQCSGNLHKSWVKKWIFG